MCVFALSASSAQAAPAWTPIIDAPGQIYDVDADRILFEQATNALGILDRRTEDVTPIPAEAGDEVVGGFLTPHGALLITVSGGDPPSGRLHEWRDGSLILLGELDSVFSVKVAGDFAIWHSGGLQKRDLDAGVTTLVSADVEESDVAANGDVVWEFAGAVRRQRGAVTETLADPPGGRLAEAPTTDGTNVVWRERAASDIGRSELVVQEPGGQSPLADTSRRSTAQPRVDYAPDGGWIAFNRGDGSPFSLWARDPAGVETQIASTIFVRPQVLGLNADGEVVYFDASGVDRTFLSIPGQASVEIGSAPTERDRGYRDFLFWPGGHWYKTIGGSLQRLTVDDGRAAGSQTTIDDGPQGVVDSSTAEFSFSSSVADATFECRLDGGAWEEGCESPRTYTGLADGPHTFVVRSVAPNGDVDPDPASQAWDADVTPPAPTVTIPAEGQATTDTTPSLAGTAGVVRGDGPDVTAELYEGPTATGTPAQTIATTRSNANWHTVVPSPLADGTWTVRARQSDHAGHTGFSAPRTFEIDTTPPEPFALRSPADGAYAGASPVFRWDEANDPGAGIFSYEVIVEGAFGTRTLTDASCGGGSCSVTPSPPFPEGELTWKVRARDLLLFVRDSEMRSLTIDATPPAPFALTAPEDGARTTDATPTLAWDATSDAGGAGVAHYDVWIDGARAATGLDGTQYTPGALADGPHAWRIDAVDGAGGVRESATRTFTVDTTAPTAALRATPATGLAGGPVELDASGSVEPFGPIVRHEWDFDGNGTFDRDTGATPTTTATFTRGEHHPAVRVTDAVGHTDTASVVVSARAVPPPGFPGISINDGARFTNDPDVTLRVVWPALTSAIVLSNDGGFADPVTLPIAGSVPWRLDTSGSDRVPRTVYARFTGLEGARETYQDDIVLDRTRPRVVRAIVLRSRTRRATRGRRTFRLRLTARDNVSGVRRMQITNDGRRPGPVRRYRRRPTVRATSPRLFVRVRDGAGNWSRWKLARRQ